MTEWLRDPLTGKIAVCLVETLDIFEDVDRIPFSDRQRAEQYAATIAHSDPEVVTVHIIDF